MRFFGKSFVLSASAMAAIAFVFPTVASAAPIESPPQYTVKNGDSYWKIAQQYQIPVSSLIEANPDEQIYNLQIGSLLVLPGFTPLNRHQGSTSAATASVISPQTGTSSTSGTATDNTTTEKQSTVSVANTTNQVSAEDLYWMAHVINAEASGESFDAQVAVGDAVLHRMKSSSQFKTVHDVVFDIEDGHYQFTCVANGSIRTTPTPSAIKAANRVLIDHVDLVPGVTVFYNPNQTPASNWVWHQEPVKTIGNLVFAK